MYRKNFLYFCCLLVLSTIVTATGISVAGRPPFSLHYHLVLPKAMGTGVSGEMNLVLTNVSQNAARDIIIRLPKNAGFSIGPNNQLQAGTLNPGEYTVIPEHLFDPQGISKTGSLDFIIDYTDSAGNRRTMEITAVGKMEVAQ